MTLQDIIAYIHSMREDLETYERKYGVLSETFYEIYTSGEEPENDAWVLDWSHWAGAYQIFLRRQDQYRKTIQSLQAESYSLTDVIEKTARREPIAIAS